jgi:Tol biopolymer transport system component
VHNVPDRNNAEYGQSVLTFRSLLTGETRTVKTRLGRIFCHQHWSPDGTRLFTRGEDTNRRVGVFVVDATTGQATTVLLRDTTASSWAVPWSLGWTASGKEVIYRRYDRDSTVRTVAADPVTGATRVLASQTHARPQDVIAQLSPDGRLIAQVVPTEDRQGTALRVTDLAGGSPRELLRVRMPDQLSTIDWAADGRHIYAVRGSFADVANPVREPLRVDRVSVVDGATRTLHFAISGNFAPIAIHPDGRRIFFTAGYGATELWELSGWWSTIPESAR